MDFFTETQREKVLFIDCPPVVAKNEVAIFQDKQKTWQQRDDIETFVFDFSKTYDLQPSFYRVFLIFKQAVRPSQKNIFSCGLKNTIKKQISNSGLIDSFNVVQNIDAELSKLTSRNQSSGKISMDVNLINPFLTATIETLTLQANTETTPKKFYLKKDEEQFDTAIAGVISLVSPKFSGNISLCFPAKVFLAIYKNMFDEEHSAVTAEIEDAAGELLNIIYGVAKTKLNDQMGHQLEKALPTILAGEKLRVRQMGKGPVFILPFTTAVGEFHIEIECNNDAKE